MDSFEGAISRFVHLGNLVLNASSSSFVLFFFKIIYLVNYYFQVSCSLKIILAVVKITP